MDDLLAKYNANYIKQEECIKELEQSVLEWGKSVKELDKLIKERDQNIRYWRRIGITVFDDGDWLLDYIIDTDNYKLKLIQHKKQLGSAKRKITWQKKKLDKENAKALMLAMENNCIS